MDFEKMAELSNDINARSPLGKGEVVSSILTGSTMEAHEMRASDERAETYPATQNGTTQEHDASGRGLPVDFDRRLFRRLALALSRQPRTQETISVRLSLLELAANPGSASAMAGLRKNFAALEAVQRQSPPGSRVD